MVNKNIGTNKINITGMQLLQTLQITHLCELSQKQIDLILSLQTSIIQIEEGKYTINNKKKRGGNLNIEKWKHKYFNKKI